MENSKNPAKAIISVAWPYANGDLHLGHPAGYLLPATILNEFLRLLGTDVVMVSGSDMHGTPVAVAAWKNSEEPLDFAKRQHKSHLERMKLLRMNYSMYTSTATQIHERVVQEELKLLDSAGFISKKQTEQYWSEKEHKYLLDRYIEGTCPNCGFEKARGDQCDNCGKTLTPDDLINPYSIFGDTELKKRKSTNYYLDLDKLQPHLEEYYGAHPNFKNWRKHVMGTIKAWLDEGLEARAITRDMEGYGVKLPLGYEVEGEEGKVIYVWFEAVTGYFSAVVELAVRSGKYNSASAEAAGWQFGELSAPETDVINDTYAGQSLDWQDYWLNKDTKSYYFMGKDNIPFHAIIWTAMILGLNKALPEDKKMVTPWAIPANQYLNLKGAKFSKSTGNIIDTKEFLAEYGEDPVRFFLITRMPENKDYDFTLQEFIEANNNELLANIGNYVNRVLVFWNKNFAEIDPTIKQSVVAKSVNQAVQAEVENCFAKTEKLLLQCDFTESMQEVLKLGSFANKYFNDNQVWSVFKEDETKATELMQDFIYLVANIGVLLRPFLPNLSAQIAGHLGVGVDSVAVGKNLWQPVAVDIETLGTIEDLNPLIRKLEAEEEKE